MTLVLPISKLTLYAALIWGSPSLIKDYFLFYPGTFTVSKIDIGLGWGDPGELFFSIFWDLKFLTKTPGFYGTWNIILGEYPWNVCSYILHEGISLSFFYFYLRAGNYGTVSILVFPSSFLVDTDWGFEHIVLRALKLNLGEELNFRGYFYIYFNMSLDFDFSFSLCFYFYLKTGSMILIALFILFE